MPEQLDLIDSVLNAYASDNNLCNEDLYKTLPRASFDALNKLSPVGKSGAKYNLFKRKVRWYQQTLKSIGLLEKVKNNRGVWRLTKEGKNKIALTKINKGFSVVAFSTKLGIALWSDCTDALNHLEDEISLVVTSPPYPLHSARAYGNVAEQKYVDWLCETLAPICNKLKDGGHIVLNISNDIFNKGNPSRSLYRERLIIALHDRLGLFKMDEIPWVNYSKPPGPVQWVSKNRQQLNVSWEPIYWLTNNPLKVDSNNQRVLSEHSKRHLKLISAGGEKRDALYGDGAYHIREGSYSAKTKGKIPKNVIERGHACKDQIRYREFCKENNIPTHGACFPTALPDFFIRFLTSANDLVFDPFGGTGKTALAAERLKRRWLLTDTISEYLKGGSSHFKDFDGFALN